MLKGLNPLLSADLLHLLQSMGHGDDVTIVDCNYPSAHADRLIAMPGISATDLLDAILSVMPLDAYVDCAAHCMAPIPPAAAQQPVFDDFRRILERHERGPNARPNLGFIERFAFYERGKTSFGIIATGERRLYGNILLKKGVINP